MVTKEMRNKMRICRTVLSRKKLIRLKPQEPQKNKKKNKIENKMSVITGTISFFIVKVETSDSLAFISSLAIDISLFPTIPNQAD